jgi:UDP-2,4-diacetamido-2,4,6-trideoxy-beta-L-altropyranose hydrolase
VRSSIKDLELGIVVDAGPQLGYGHAVRCVRLAQALESETSITFFPMSEVCAAFLRDSSLKAEIRNPNSEIGSLPPLVITDLREAHGITTDIHRLGSRHISIHDLGLAQCWSDVVIDGSVTQLFPYPSDKERSLYVGPKYMITRKPVARQKPKDKVVFITFGGGTTANLAQKLSDEISRMGLTPVTTRGFIGSAPMSDAEFAETMATCRFAISGAGTTLYDMLASRVPTIAVAFDRLQLRTADAFHERGAVLSAGLLDHLSPSALKSHCKEMLENKALIQRMTDVGHALVDGKGLSRVVEIVRREIWLTSREKTFTAC